MAFVLKQIKMHFTVACLEIDFCSLFCFFANGKILCHFHAVINVNKPDMIQSFSYFET